MTEYRQYCYLGIALLDTSMWRRVNDGEPDTASSIGILARESQRIGGG